MTNKQQRFCTEYLKDLNGTQAAIRAGYSANTAGEMAHENLKKPEILNCIASTLNTMRDEGIADAEEVLRFLTAVMRGEEGKKKQVFHTRKGDQLVISGPPISARLRAADLLARVYGMYKTEVQVNNSQQAIVFIEHDSPQ